jgi:hypothetical protein
MSNNTQYNGIFTVDPKETPILNTIGRVNAARKMTDARMQKMNEILHDEYKKINVVFRFLFWLTRIGLVKVAVVLYRWRYE